MNPYLMSVDIGTQGTKAGLFREDGVLIADAFEPSRLVSPCPGTVWQEPDELYGSCVCAMRRVMDASGVPPRAVAGVGMSGQMAGILGVGEGFEAVTPYDSWLDTRCEPQISRMKARAGDRVIRLTGAPVSYSHGPKILWWKDTAPEIYKKIRKFTLPVGYVAGRLCGLSADEAYMDATCAHFSGFADLRRLKWSAELLEEFGVDAAKMPRFAQPCERAGTLGAAQAEACGLLEGTPVAAGAGDQAAASLGAGIVSPGQAFDVAGTASVFSCATDAFAPDAERQTALCPRSIVPGLWIPIAYINGGGLCVRWARDLLSRSKSYDELNALAETVEPGSDGLVFVPHFSGRVCPYNPDIRGSFAGLTAAHGAGHLYRSVLEGIGYEYHGYLSILRELTGRDFSEVRAVGGGARSRVFSQIKSDILGIPYTAVQTADTGLLGGAIMAGVCAGVYGDPVEPALRITRKTETIAPDSRRHERYQPYAAVYRAQCEALNGVYRMLSRIVSDG